MARITYKIANNYIRKGRKLPANTELTAWSQGRLIGVATTGHKGERPEVTPETTAGWLLKTFKIEACKANVEALVTIIQQTVEKGSSITELLTDRSFLELLDEWRGRVVGKGKDDGLRPPGPGWPPRHIWYQLDDTLSLFRRIAG